MAQLILLVVAAAWLAVLIPPMLRSRVENRPNSSVTDFRRQLTKLQNTATPPRGAVRAMGRPLAQSPLSRPVASGRPGQPQLRSGVTRHATPSELAAQANTATLVEREDTAPRFRSHGDPTGGKRRPAERQPRARQERDDRVERSDSSDASGGQRRHRDLCTRRALSQTCESGESSNRVRIARQNGDLGQEREPMWIAQTRLVGHLRHVVSPSSTKRTYAQTVRATPHLRNFFRCFWHHSRRMATYPNG